MPSYYPYRGYDSDIRSRVTDICVNVKSFGAIGDGAADDLTAIKNAITAISTSGGVVYFPAGTYRVSDTIEIKYSNIFLRGSGKGSQIHLDDATKSALYFYHAVGISDVGVSDITINSFDKATNTRTDGTGIYMGPNVGSFIIQNVRVRNGYDGITLDSAYTGLIDNVEIDGSIATVNGINVVNTSISNTIRKVSIVCTGIGVNIDNGTDTLEITDCGVQKSGAQEPAYGFKFQNTVPAVHNPRWVRLTNCFTEVSDTGTGYSISKAYDVAVVNCYNYGGLYGMTIGAGSNEIKVIGGVYFGSQQYGVLIDAGTHITFNNVTITKNSQVGSGTAPGLIVAPGVLHLNISNCICGDTLTDLSTITNHQSYGVQVLAGGSNYYIITNNDMTGNVSGGLDDSGGGANKTVSGNL